jgi:hypothetical protein
MPDLLNPRAPAFADLGSSRGAQAIDDLERSIADTIRQWRPGQKTAVLSQRKVELLSLHKFLLQRMARAPLPTGPERIAQPPKPSGLIDAALQKTTEAHLQALSQSGLPISALSLLQSWMELTVDARALQQQIDLERAINSLQTQDLDTGAPVYSPDPAEPLSAAELGKALGGLSDETVRHREKAGELFSILRPGRKRGREYPAFQAWNGITGGPLTKVLSKLGTLGAVIGADAYSFFTSQTDLLGELTPIEALLGSLTTARSLDPATQRFLNGSADERLSAVLQAAEAYAAQVDA